MLTPEQIFAANKHNVAAAFGFGAKAFEGAEKLTELHLQLAKTAMTEALRACARCPDMIGPVVVGHPATPS